MVTDEQGNSINETNRLQWIKLITLTGVHFSIDMYAGMIAAILPQIREHFELSIKSALVVLSSLYLTAHGIQMFVGHLREHKTRPLLLPIGLIMATAMCLIAFVNKEHFMYPSLIILAVISGTGIAIAHPESLRALHGLKQISPALSTTVFMTGGFFGFAAGSLVSSSLVQFFGFQGLLLLLLLPIILIILVYAFNIRMAIESGQRRIHDENFRHVQLPFEYVLALAIPVSASTTLILALLPTRLNELGFELTYGGFSAMLFGMGSAIGAYFWASIARNNNELRSTVISLFAGLPFLFVYFLFMHSRLALILLFIASVCSSASYPMIVTMARHAYGPNLGRRMGFVAGGTWFIASLLLLSLGYVIQKFGTISVLVCTPFGYLVAAIAGIWIIKKIKLIKQ
jgi:FSR family fosmidomycin resistance protein-like MFS transporter